MTILLVETHINCYTSITVRKGTPPRPYTKPINPIKKMKSNTDKLNLGLLVRVSFTKFNPIKSNKTMKAEYAAKHGSDASMHTSTTRVVHKKFIDPLQKIETLARQLCEKLTLPWEDRGNRLLPADNVVKFQTELAALRRKWDDAVEEFIVEWDKIVEDAKARLNGDFRESNYPPAEFVRTVFKMSAIFMPMPDNSRLVDSIRDEMEDIFDVRLKAAGDELRTRLITTLEHLATKCKQVGGEDSSRFHTSNVTNVLELCELIPDMLVGDDPALLAAIADAKSMLASVDASSIKSSVVIADDIRVKAAAIANSLI